MNLLNQLINVNIATVVKAATRISKCLGVIILKPLGEFIRHILLFISVCIKIHYLLYFAQVIYLSRSLCLSVFLSICFLLIKCKRGDCRPGAPVADAAD